jgi:hypothetical protein
MDSNRGLYLLFQNISYLLQQDLRTYKMYDVEERDFEALLKFLKDVLTDVDSLERSQKISSRNVAAAYAIPVLFDTIHKHRGKLSPLHKAPFPETKKYVKAVYDRLVQFRKEKDLPIAMRDALLYFFDVLRARYTVRDNFESVKTIQRKHEGQYV